MTDLPGRSTVFALNSLFAEDAIIQDPVGKDPIQGKTAIADTCLLGLAVSNHVRRATFETRLQAGTVAGGPEAMELTA